MRPSCTHDAVGRIAEPRFRIPARRQQPRVHVGSGSVAGDRAVGSASEPAHLGGSGIPPQPTSRSWYGARRPAASLRSWWAFRTRPTRRTTIGVARASTPPGVGDVNAMSSTARSRSAARAGNAPRPPKHGDVLRPPDVTADSTSHLGSAARPNPTSHHHVPDEIRPDEEHPRALGAVGNSVTLMEPHQPCSPPLRRHAAIRRSRATSSNASSSEPPSPSLSTFAGPLRISCRPCLFRGLPAGRVLKELVAEPS